MYTLEVVQAYMKHIQTNAEISVRQMLKDFGHSLGSNVLKASDFLDDGTEIKLVVTIDSENGSATFDFT